MRIIIIEDEDYAAERLESILVSIDGCIQIEAVIESVYDAIAWLRRHTVPDLIFLDVQLSDGICFEIFNTVDITCPVILTTAYDEYAIQAFKLNSIDYLLKPVDRHAMEQSLEKFHRLKNNSPDQAMRNIDALLDHLQLNKTIYKNRFLVKHRGAYHTIPSEDILLFFTESQLVHLLTKEERRRQVEYTLNDIEERVDPDRFFRINRQMIVSVEAIKSIGDYFNHRLKLKLCIEFAKDIIVSRGKVHAFKTWLDG